MLFRTGSLILLLTAHGPTLAADDPRHVDLGPGLTSLTTLEQNWSDEESNWFYNVAQGSRLVPYEWFLHLEQANSTEPFNQAKTFHALGYIPRTKDSRNPGGLPIGFVKDAGYDDGTPGLGLSCAACHTSQINRGGKAFLIDGAPGMGDFERLMRELAASLAATAADDQKFERFAAALLPAGAASNEKAALRAGLRTVAKARSDYNDRNLPKTAAGRFGHGRVDAFGAILNEVSSRFLDRPENAKPANAPVSYPCLWDAPQHERVQWNGAAENRVSPLGIPLFGTDAVGALGRNAGEVMGVFGYVEINANELLLPRRYSSTVNKTNLIAIEKSLRKLWSPKWPQDALGALDEEKRAKGEVLFGDHCVACHANIDRTDERRRVAFKLSDGGTDPTLNQNFGRLVQTGRLKGRRKTLLGLERFGREEPAAVVLKHVVERVILDPLLDPSAIRNAVRGAAANPLVAIDSLNPGFRMTAIIEVGKKKLLGDFDSLVTAGRTATFGGGRFHLMEMTRDPNASGRGDDLVDLRSAGSVKAAAQRLQGVVVEDGDNVAAAALDEAAKATLNDATVTIGYKSRPLNGVWATAPYLHNGSVPNLVELLKPASRRVKQFHVGGKEYDAVNVGFVDDPTKPLFDTTVEGNSNAGHEYGALLTGDQCAQLLEYLKSL